MLKILAVLTLMAVFRVFHIPKRYKGKLAWSLYLRSWIRVTAYYGEDDWYFVMCDEKGRHTAGTYVMKAGSNIDVFTWVEEAEIRA